MRYLQQLPELTDRPLEYGPAAPVPIFQHRFEFDQLLELYRSRAPRRVLEIGTYFGGSLYHFLKHAAPGARIVTVDTYAVDQPTYPVGWNGQHTVYAAGVDNRHLYPEWTPDGVQLEVICGDSHDSDTVARVTDLGPYDWVWIDAGHYYAEVKQDWDLYRPMVRSGGLVCFHDVLPPSPTHPEIEVNRLWREIQAQGYLTQEIIADPAADWGGIGIAYCA